MKFSYMTVMVRDLERSIAFYRDLAGLAVVRRFNPGPGEIAFLDDGEGGTMLELIQFEAAEKASAAGLVLSFQAGDALEELRERVAGLGCPVTEIVDRGPKPKYFRVSDPDGLTVEFSA